MVIQLVALWSKTHKKPPIKTMGKSRSEAQFVVTVPDNVEPGQEFKAYAGSRRVRVICPPGCKPGERLEITVPSLKCDRSRSVSSKVADRSNEFLWGNWENGKHGVMVRTLDVIDDVGTEGQRSRRASFPRGELQLLPASFLHASMKAPNPMFMRTREKQKWAVGVLVASKLNINTINGQQNKKIANVNLTLCYPMDAASMERNNVENGKNVLLTKHGGGCAYDHTPETLCMDDKCLMDNQCRCRNSSTIPSYADFIIDLFDRTEGKAMMNFHSCWYEANRLDELRDAVNSLWIKRHRYADRRNQWTAKIRPSSYKGWTECLLTINAIERSSVDAFVIQVPVGEDTCEDPRKISLLESDLKELHWRYGHKPVLFLEQTRGMKKEECDQYWESKDCRDGYRKDFYAQNWSLPEGSCLAKPSSCEDVYYFPVGSDGTCNITTPKVCEVYRPYPSREVESSFYIKDRNEPVAMLGFIPWIGILWLLWTFRRLRIIK